MVGGKHGPAREELQRVEVRSALRLNVQRATEGETQRGGGGGREAGEAVKGAVGEVGETVEVDEDGRGQVQGRAID